MQTPPVAVRARPEPPELSAGESACAVSAVDLRHRYGTTEALAGVSLQIARGEFFSLLGPSGCGKTTLLRLIAGLEIPHDGELRIGGRDAAGWPAHQRPVNTVFQSYALFPHLSVADNIAFGLRMKRVPARETGERVARMLELMAIAPLADRAPAQLSGGQRQRVALARALVNEPAVLLLDEPLAALDLQLRHQLRGELRQLQRRLGITFIFVTHDQEEAMSMSDRIAVMHAGRIAQLDTVEALYEHPRNRFVAQFLGACNLVPGRWAGAGAGCVTTELGDLVVAARAAGADPAAVGGKVTLAIRPEKLRVRSASEATAGPNTCPAVVAAVEYCGAETHYRLDVQGATLTVREANTGTGRTRRTPGETVRVELPPDALRVLED